LLPTIWVAHAATRARGQRLRGRAFLVRQRRQLKNRIHGHLTAEKPRCPTTDLYGKAGRTWLTSVALSPALRAQVDVLLRLVDTLSRDSRARSPGKRAARGNAVATQLQSSRAWAVRRVDATLADGELDSVHEQSVRLVRQIRGKRL